MNQSSNTESEYQSKVRAVLETYRNSRPTIFEWTVNRTENGRIETSWYREHKGEVILKIRINTDQRPPLVTVVQKISWLIFFERESSDTEWARRTRLEIVELISKI